MSPRCCRDRLRREHRRSRGQSSVEFALVVPLVVVSLLVAIQVGLVVITKLAVTHTAREVARALSIDPSADPDRIAAAVHPGDGERSVTVEWRPAPLAGGRMVVVRVEQLVPRLAGPLGPTVQVSSTAVMLAEAG